MKKQIFKIQLLAVVLAGLTPASLKAQSQTLWIAANAPQKVYQYTTGGTQITQFSPTADYAIGIAATANDVFVGRYGGGVSEYTTTGTLVGRTINNSGTYYALAIAGNDLFIGGNGTTIGEYNATSGALINASYITGLASAATQMAISDGVMYLSMGNGNVAKYNISGSSGALISSSLIGTVGGLTGVAISGDGTDLYVSTTANVVGEYNASTGAAISASLISGLHDPNSLAIAGNELYVDNYNNNGAGSIGEYNLDGSVVSATLISGLTAPFNITAAPTPEPSTMALAGLGCVGMLAMRRRK